MSKACAVTNSSSPMYSTRYRDKLVSFGWASSFSIAKPDEEQPDLEAQLLDGAWYDINLLAADPSRDRILVQVRTWNVRFPCIAKSRHSFVRVVPQTKDLPNDEEWVGSTAIRLQSQPFENPPTVGKRRKSS